VGEQVTTEEKYAAIGKAHSDLKTAKEKLRVAVLAANQMGSELIKAGEILVSAPHLAGINGESPMPSEDVFAGVTQIFDRKIFNADKYRDLTREIRDTRREIADLERKLAGE
jgi:hypothetical protein